MYLYFKKMKTKSGAKLAVIITESRRCPKTREPKAHFVGQVGTFAARDFDTQRGNLEFWVKLKSTMDKLGLSDLNREQIKRSARRRVKNAPALPVLI